MRARTIYEALRWGQYGWEPRRWPEPTNVLPGKQKVDILRARLSAGEELFHPEDAPKPDPEEAGLVRYELPLVRFLRLMEAADDERKIA